MVSMLAYDVVGTQFLAMQRCGQCRLGVDFTAKRQNRSGAIIDPMEQLFQSQAGAAPAFRKF
jgi:hypothetical protein